jgi:Protein of unknown function (DUF3631)
VYVVTGEDKKKILEFRPPSITDESAAERASRLKTEVDRLARLPPVEWMYYLDDTAKKHGITSAKLKTMVERVIKEREKKAREDKADDEKSKKYAERQRVTKERAEQKAQHRAQEQADKEAERKVRAREEALEVILKLPCAEHEPRLAELARRSGEDLDFLRGELAQRVEVETEIIEKSSGADSVETWPEPVDTKVLLTEVMAQLRRYVVVHDDAAAVAMVLWIFFSWMHDTAVHSTLLVIRSADADAGKTTTGNVLRFLSMKGHAAAELTGPALFRFVDHVKPTLFMDDADNLLKRRPDLVHIINVSWTRGTLIYRSEHGHMRAFDPFCAKVIIGVDPYLPKATWTRCIEVQLLPKLPDEKVEDFKHADDDDFVTLRRKLARWRDDNVVVLKDARPVSDLNNRLRMNWQVLLAVADLAGGDWPKRARAAAVKLNHERPEPSPSKRLLQAFQVLITQEPLLTSKRLEELLPTLDEEWGNFNGKGRAINRWEVANLLRPYRIKPGVIHPRGRVADRGYDLRWPEIEIAFKHYLPKTPTGGRTIVRKARGKRRK